MSDLISRQAAIDALEKVAELFPWRVPGKRDTYDSYNEAWNDAIGRAEMEIENLPSAQPDRSLWFRIGEFCVGESKGDISAEMAVEKIRELLREAERREG